MAEPTFEKFRTEYTVHFRHCDVAGIIFYPRYVEMISDTVERWFDLGLGCNFHDLHLVRHLGVPTVHLDIDYKAATTLGEVLTFDLWLTRVSRRSFSTRIEASVDGEVRMQVRSTLVFIRSGNAFLGEDKMTSVSIPDDLRNAMTRYLDQGQSDD